MKKNIKIMYIITGVLIYLYFMIGGIVVGKMQGPLIGKLLFAGSAIIAILIWVISLAKIHKEKPIVFDLKKYRYNPADKRKLSLREVVYYMRDLLLVKLFYGVAIFMCVFILIVMDIIFLLQEMKLTDIIAMNLSMLISMIIISLIFFLSLYITKRNDCTELLLKNTSAYMDIQKADFLNYLEVDLQKGIRFRSKKLVLTNQYIIGVISQFRLSPVAIPIEQVKLIKYNVYFYGGLSGNRFMKAEFRFELLNQKRVVLYVNYVQWEIVVKMLEHYGFTVLAEE